jgi:hypothetical protein
VDGFVAIPAAPPLAMKALLNLLDDAEIVRVVREWEESRE